MAERPSVVEIDLSDVGDAPELHRRLSHALDFPEWYGRNWNAFWDAITGLVEMPDRLVFIGWSKFAVRLPEDAAQLRSCLDQMNSQCSEGRTDIEYK